MDIDFSEIKVVVFGDIMLDEYWIGDCHRISPEAPVPVVSINRRDFRLGGAANVALNVKTLGGSVTLVGCVGNDDAGTNLEKLVNKAGINSKIIQKTNSVTTKKIRIVSGFQQVARTDFECNAKLHIQNDFEPFAHLISSADIIIISDYEKGFVYHASKVIKIGRKFGKRIIVDPKKKNYLEYTGASIITPNLKEFENMVGACDNEGELNNKANKLVNLLNLESLLLTRGSDGMSLFSTENRFDVPAIAKEIFDVSGAGDTVIAALGLAIASGMEHYEAVKFANKCASIVVTKFGTSAITTAELAL